MRLNKYDKPVATTTTLRTVCAFILTILVSPAVSLGIGTVAVIELVPQLAASADDVTMTLPTALTQVEVGDSFVIEVWAQTLEPQGLSSVSTSIGYDSTLAEVTNVTHTALFSELNNAEIDNSLGLIANLSGSHLSTCVDQVGVAPQWARVAVIAVQATASGSLVMQAGDTGSLTFGTAICGVGDLPPAQIAYGMASVTIVDAPIPAVSTWGLIVTALLIMAAGSIMIDQKAHLKPQA